VSCGFNPSESLHTFCNLCLGYKWKYPAALFAQMNHKPQPLFFFGGVTATAPSRDLTDNKKKRREGSSRGESKRKLLKETQNQGKETRKKKRTQVEYRGASSEAFDDDGVLHRSRGDSKLPTTRLK